MSTTEAFTPTTVALIRVIEASSAESRKELTAFSSLEPPVYYPGNAALGVLPAITRAYLFSQPKYLEYRQFAANGERRNTLAPDYGATPVSYPEFWNKLLAIILARRCLVLPKKNKKSVRANLQALEPDNFGFQIGDLSSSAKINYRLKVDVSNPKLAKRKIRAFIRYLGRLNLLAEKREIPLYVTCRGVLVRKVFGSVYYVLYTIELHHGGRVLGKSNRNAIKNSLSTSLSCPALPVPTGMVMPASISGITSTAIPAIPSNPALLPAEIISDLSKRPPLYKEEKIEEIASTSAKSIVLPIEALLGTDSIIQVVETLIRHSYATPAKIA